MVKFWVISPIGGTDNATPNCCIDQQCEIRIIVMMFITVEVVGSNRA